MAWYEIVYLPSVDMERKNGQLGGYELRLDGYPSGVFYTRKEAESEGRAYLAEKRFTIMKKKSKKGE